MDQITHMRVGSLHPYPQSVPADQQVQDEIIKLWKANHSFIILSGPPGVGKTRAAEDFPRYHPQTF